MTTADTFARRILARSGRYNFRDLLDFWHEDIAADFAERPDAYAAALARLPAGHEAAAQAVTVMFLDGVEVSDAIDPDACTTAYLAVADCYSARYAHHWTDDYFAHYGEALERAGLNFDDLEAQELLERCVNGLGNFR